MKAKVLIVDDDRAIREGLLASLQDTYEVEMAENGEVALKTLGEDEIDLMLLDVRLPGMDGLEVLRRIKSENNPHSIVMMTGYATVEAAVEAMKLGAYDYLKKPIRFQEVKRVIDRALERKTLVEENRYLREQLQDTHGFQELIGKSKAVQTLVELLRRIAPTESTVLVQGESGTGKEIVAKTIHFNSPRKDHRFIPINCGGIPETLLESELFGHTKGAFTGADRSKKGLFEVAENGTLFLDEINTAPPSIQVKLLRVLQEGSFIPLGSTREVNVDVRIIASSNIDLEKAVEEGRFRGDLYYRLNVVRIVLQPLRERKEDISLLAEHFLKNFSKKGARKELTQEALQVFLRYNWPGNVRELENAIEYAMTLGQGAQIEVEDIPPAVTTSREQGALPMKQIPLREAKAEFEKEYIVNLLKRNKGNVARSARMAKIARQNLHEKIKRYGLNHKIYAQVSS
jgi:DNA-binding NtrC family response regulator